MLPLARKRSALALSAPPLPPCAARGFSLAAKKDAREGEARENGALIRAAKRNRQRRPPRSAGRWNKRALLGRTLAPSRAA